MKFRGMEEGMRYESELRQWAVGSVHHTIRIAMKPIMLISAMYWGHEITMANIFTIIMMLGKLNWPMQMMPHFMESLRNTKR